MTLLAATLGFPFSADKLTIANALAIVNAEARPRVFRYCPWGQIAAAERVGWIVCYACPAYHGHYSVVVEWLCGCAPRDWRRP